LFGKTLQEANFAPNSQKNKPCLYLNHSIRSTFCTWTLKQPRLLVILKNSAMNFRICGRTSARACSNKAELQQDDIAYAFGERAGIYAEFGKIICISVGFMTRQPGSDEPVLRLKSFTNHVEGALLDDFSELLNKHFSNPEKFAVCGHNIREFDIPYICRRMLVNQMPLPRVLDIAGKKPWEVKHLLDTLEMWKFWRS
jgi:hypothetical protein